MRFERGKIFTALLIQRDLDDGCQRRPKLATVEYRHGALDHAALFQFTHPAQTGRRRCVHPRGKRMVGQRCILLQVLEDAVIKLV